MRNMIVAVLICSALSVFAYAQFDPRWSWRVVGYTKLTDHHNIVTYSTGKEVVFW